MVDIPERTESHGPVFIYGVEGEQIEEENDAYNDLRYDIGTRNILHGSVCLTNLLNCYNLLLEFNDNIIIVLQWKCLQQTNNSQTFPGLHKDYEADEAEELMPSCFPLLIFDCIFMKIKNCFVPSSKKEKAEKEEYWSLSHSTKIL